MAVVSLNTQRRDKNNTLFETTNNIYYNINIFNDSEIPDFVKLATYSENRVVALIDNPNDYEVGIVKFNMSTALIPLLVWDYNNQWFVTLSFGGQDFREQLLYQPDNKLFGTGQDALWKFGKWVKSINDAMTFAFINLKSQFPTAPQNIPPYLTFDPVTQLFSLHAETSYNRDLGLSAIAVMFSPDLFNIMSSFEVSSDSVPPPIFPTKGFRIEIYDRKNNSEVVNGVNQFVMSQEFVTAQRLNRFDNLLFETNSIPVESEALSGQKNVTRRILTDFTPNIDVSNQQIVQFFPQGPIRYYDLKSNYPLNKIDLTISWSDKSGAVYPLGLIRGDNIKVKLHFRKKINKRIQDAFEGEDSL
jgi:hypothetical protein